MKKILSKIYDKSKITLNYLPDIFYKNKLSNIEDKKNFYKLKENGFLKFEKILSDEKCKKINQAINDYINSEKMTYILKQKVWKNSSIDRFISETEEVLSFRSIDKIVSDYFRKESFISDFDVRRVEPASYEEISKMGKSNSDWHKDTRGMQLKLMIYLSDVSEKDNHFSLIPGTHNNKIYNFADSRFQTSQIDSSKELKIIGKKGMGILFDTNIIHRLNRLPNSNKRDSLTLNFTPGQFLKKIFFGNDNLIKNKELKKKLIGSSLFSSRD